MKKPLLIPAMIVLNLLATHTLAVDGVLEINQTCAAQLGCFSGDNPGYPITIDGSAGGSYRLTSNLIVPNINTNGIEITSASISLDLNGFEIVRSGCEDALSDCTPAAGTGSGIYISHGIYYGVTVRNGSIVGMGLHGARIVGTQAVVTGITARWNRGTGIRTGSAASVTDNLVYDNFGDGIYTSFASIVSGNTVFANRGHGIVADEGSSVRENTVRRNSSYGLNLDPTAAYSDNVITGNTMGTVLSGYDMGNNFCDTDAVCP